MLNNEKQDMEKLCALVKKCVGLREFDKCYDEVCAAMAKYPDLPNPHNLLGIILEKKGRHPDAMRHFRAAWALDPTYLPARYNLEVYGTFFSTGDCAYNIEDCEKHNKKNWFNI